MTESIRIPVCVSDGCFKWHCHAEVSADIARQIVELAQDAKPCAHPHAKVLLAPGPVVRWCPDCQQNLPQQDAQPTFAPGWHCPHCNTDIPGGQYHDCKQDTKPDADEAACPTCGFPLGSNACPTCDQHAATAKPDADATC